MIPNENRYAPVADTQSSTGAVYYGFSKKRFFLQPKHERGGIIPDIALLNL